jgi:hypothetical protein
MNRKLLGLVLVVALSLSIVHQQVIAACGELQFNKFQASGTNFVLQWLSQTDATYERRL